MLLVLIAADADGIKHFLALEEAMTESEQWAELFEKLKERDLRPPKLLIADGANGLWSAATKAFADTAQQRCCLHKQRNLLDKIPEAKRDVVHAELREIMHAGSEPIARRRIESLARSLQADYPKAATCLRDDLDRQLAFYRFPQANWKNLRTTNPIESMFASVRLRTDATKRMRTGKSATYLLYALITRLSTNRRRIDGHREIRNMLRRDLDLKKAAWDNRRAVTSPQISTEFETSSSVKRIFQSALSAIVLTLAVTACGGGGGSLPSAPQGVPQPGTAQGSNGLLTVEIVVPKQTSLASQSVHKEYFSPATQSVVITAVGPSPATTKATAYVNVSPSNPACTGYQSTTCNVSLGLTKTGTYTLTFVAYDHIQSSTAGPFVGRPLATNQTQLKFVAGTTKTYTVSLDGIPAYFTVSPNGNGYLQGSRTGLTLYGSSSQQLLVVALDRDGNPIIGPGAPTIKLTPSAASLSVTPTGTSNPNVFTLQAKTSGTPAVVTPGIADLTASASQPPPSGAGSVTTTVPVRITHSVIVGSTAGGLGEYFDGNTLPSVTLNTTGLVAMNNSGNVFIGNGYSIKEYPAGQSSSTLSITVRTTTGQDYYYGSVDGLGIDVFDNVYATQVVTSCCSIQPDTLLSMYLSGSMTPGTARLLSSSSNLGAVLALAVDAVGGEYVTAHFYDSTGFNAFYISTPAVTFQTTDQPGAIGVDGKGTVYVDLSKGVTEFPAGTSTPSITLPSHGPISVDAADNVYIGNVEYSAGSTTQLKR